MKKLFLKFKNFVIFTFSVKISFKIPLFRFRISIRISTNKQMVGEKKRPNKRPCTKLTKTNCWPNNVPKVQPYKVRWSTNTAYNTTKCNSESAGIMEAWQFPNAYVNELPWKFSFFWWSWKLIMIELGFEKKMPKKCPIFHGSQMKRN